MAVVTPPADQQIPFLDSDNTVYFNGFAVGVGMGDIPITLTRNGVSILTLNCSYTVAKTLANALTECISSLERAASHEIMTVQQIQAAASVIAGHSGQAL
jgi:hypothetical protein